MDPPPLAATTTAEASSLMERGAEAHHVVMAPNNSSSTIPLANTTRYSTSINSGDPYNSYPSCSSLGVLQFANMQAGCPQDADGSYTNCGNKVYGMQPSSMLAFMAIIGGVSSTSCFMPYAGSVVDFSIHRLEFGKVNALLLTLTNFVQIFLTKKS